MVLVDRAMNCRACTNIVIWLDAPLIAAQHRQTVAMTPKRPGVLVCKAPVLTRMNPGVEASDHD
jgi:hypothetical protein